MSSNDDNDKGRKGRQPTVTLVSQCAALWATLTDPALRESYLASWGNVSKAERQRTLGYAVAHCLDPRKVDGSPTAPSLPLVMGEIARTVSKSDRPGQLRVCLAVLGAAGLTDDAAIMARHSDDERAEAARQAAIAAAKAGQAVTAELSF